LLALIYLALRRMLALILLRCRSQESKELEILVLFFIELASRRVHLAGCSENPSGTWVAQQAHNLARSFDERASLRFLIHDRDSKFTDAFDEVFRSEGIEVIRTPSRRRRRMPSPSGSSARSGASASTGS